MNGSALFVNLVTGALLASVVAFVSVRRQALTRSGAVAAIVVGTSAAAAGWRWGVLLVLFFVTSVALSRWGAPRKSARTGSVVTKGGARDAAQVLANGGLFAAIAIFSLFLPENIAGIAWTTLAGGALACATADTWSTEIGTLVGGTPRSITSLRPVEAGLSGGVTGAGTLACVGGAAFLAAAAYLLGWTSPLAIAVGGVAGGVTDSLLGALVQERRRCTACGVATEQPMHRCGGRSEIEGGIAGLTNDWVNVGSGVVAAAVAALVA